MIPSGLSQRSRAEITGAEHTLVDPESPQPLRDNDIDTLWRLDLQDVALDHLNDLPYFVRHSQLLRQDGNRRLLDRVDPRCASPCRENAQDAATRSDIEDDITGAHHRLDRAPESFGTHAVADHRPVNLELRVHGVRRMPDRCPHALNVLSPGVALRTTPRRREAARVVQVNPAWPPDPLGTPRE